MLRTPILAIILLPASMPWSSMAIVGSFLSPKRVILPSLVYGASFVPMLNSPPLMRIFFALR